MKHILVTGGAGFIGSNFIKYILNKYHDYKIINADALTYAGNLENLKEIEHNPHYKFFHADIRDRVKMNEIFQLGSIDTVVNFAAESHVDRSIVESEIFLKTNILGTNTLLETAKNFWGENSKVKFIQISTDEVYGTLGETGSFEETMPLLPNNPYSASKASADMIVRSYNKTFGLPVNITRSSNNYGPHQFPEKLIPLIIMNSINNINLPIYGDGMQVRDWLYVYDHCSAIDSVLHKGVDGEVYNIGGNSEKTNIEIAKLILKILKKPEHLIEYVHDRPGHDRRYAINSSKIITQLNWKPVYTFEKGMTETIHWYLKYYSPYL